MQLVEYPKASMFWQAILQNDSQRTRRVPLSDPFYFLQK